MARIKKKPCMFWDNGKRCKMWMGGIDWEESYCYRWHTGTGWYKPNEKGEEDIPSCWQFSELDAILFAKEKK